MAEWVWASLKPGIKRFPLQSMDYAYPCGICRQVLREFSDPKQMEVLICKSTEDYKEMTLEELLPESFGPEK